MCIKCSTPFVLLLVIIHISVWMGTAVDVTDGSSRPHILFILADDYGWASFGPHRQANCKGNKACEQAQKEVHTPTLNRLVEEGILLERHYAYRICSPSRSSLQSGRLAVHVNAKNTGVTSYNESDPISGYAGIPRNMTGMAEKLSQLGYSTHMVGKWDAGMATPQHTPWGRGYDTWLGYFQHANDYWTKGGNIQATGEIDNCLNSFTDFFETGPNYKGGVLRHDLLTDSCKDSTAWDPSCYEEHIFKRRALEIIASHDATVPMFMFYSFHLLHTPLQVPLAYQKRIVDIVHANGGDSFSSQNRMLYAAMTLYMDDTVDELTKAIQDKPNMWENTLVVFTADNGGPIYEPGSANNHPLKGGKYSDWEGGVRTNAFLSGGFIPIDLRKTHYLHIVSIADWYATLCVIGGGTTHFCTSDPKADKANAWIRRTNAGLPLLHGIDSVPQWDAIKRGSAGRSGAFHLSENALIDWPMKLVIGNQDYSAWTGELYPNCSTIWNLSQGLGPQFVDFKVFDVPQGPSNATEAEIIFWQENCSAGCLYNIELDPTEHVNVADRHPVVVERMMIELAELNKHNFMPYRGDGVFKACARSLANGHYYGPFVDVDGWYTEPFVPINSTDNKELLARLLLVNGPGGKVQDVITGLFEMASPIISIISGYRTDVCLEYKAFAESEAYGGSASIWSVLSYQLFLVGGCGFILLILLVCARRWLQKKPANKDQLVLPTQSSREVLCR